VCDRLGIEPGQRLSWAPRLIDSGSIVDAPKAAATNQEESQLSALIASQDERFRSLATFLIGRNGFEVGAVAALNDVLEQVAKTRFDLVVLDCAESFSAAARVVAALEVMHPTVRSVLVSDPPAAGWHNGLNVLDKWTSIERLPSMILGDETDAQLGTASAAKRW
jgi:CheY-like chemotaxis protein